MKYQEESDHNNTPYLVFASFITENDFTTYTLETLITISLQINNFFEMSHPKIGS